MLLSTKYSFRLVSKKRLKILSEKVYIDRFIAKISERSNANTEDASPSIIGPEIQKIQEVQKPIEISGIGDENKRTFLKVAGIAGAGILASQLIPKRADALVMGSTPSSSVVGVKNASNTRINPATEETIGTLLTGQGVTKMTTSLAASGNVRTPASGKKIRVYASRFSLTADATSVSFRFTSGGTDYEKYLAPKTGGLYGSNNHPNYIEGGVDQVLYCVISGTTTVQINIDYLEV